MERRGENQPRCGIWELSHLSRSFPSWCPQGVASAPKPLPFLRENTPKTENRRFKDQPGSRIPNTLQALGAEAAPGTLNAPRGGSCLPKKCPCTDTAAAKHREKKFLRIPRPVLHSAAPGGIPKGIKAMPEAPRHHQCQNQGAGDRAAPASALRR